MSTILTRPTNGVSYGYRHTVTAQDVSDGEIIFDFQVDKDLVANIQVYDSNNVVVNTSDIKVSYPAKGQVKIENGTMTFALVVNQRIDIVAQWARTD